MADNHHQFDRSVRPGELQKSAVVANILKGYEDFTLDVHGKIISSNLEAVNITGYEEWEAIGRHFSLFYTQQDKDSGQPEADLARARTDGRLTFSAWRVKKRNVTFWAQITLICIREEEGFITGFKMILKDQTHRLISNNRVRKFRTEYLNVFNNPFIGIVKFRVNDFKITLINEKASKIIGIGKEPIKFNEVFGQPEEFQRFYDLLVRDGKVCDFEFRLNPGGAGWCRIDCRLFPEEGFVEGVLNDVTESKNQLLELKRLNDELDSFIYHASHDLRSPLTSLLGLINLAELDTGMDLKDYCKMMRERVTYLDELLKDMTSIAFNSKEKVVAEPVDFEKIVNGVIYKVQSEYPFIQFSLDLINVTVFHTDQQRLQTIFRNIIGACAKNYNSRVTHPYIRINIEFTDKSVAIIIQDNGKGIRDDQLAQVFGMFYKVTSESMETGLGLYIAKLMVEKLNGNITLNSKQGEGTSFEFELPDLRHDFGVNPDSTRTRIMELKLPSG